MSDPPNGSPTVHTLKTELHEFRLKVEKRFQAEQEAWDLKIAARIHAQEARRDVRLAKILEVLEAVYDVVIAFQKPAKQIGSGSQQGPGIFLAKKDLRRISVVGSAILVLFLIVAALALGADVGTLGNLFGKLIGK